MTNEIWKTDQSHSVYEFLIKFSLTFFLHFFFHFSFTHLKHAAVVSRICSTNTYLFSFFFWSQTDTWDIIKRFLNTAKVQSFQGPINSYAQSIKKKKFKKHFLKRFKKKNLSLWWSCTLPGIIYCSQFWHISFGLVLYWYDYKL